jgi:hypothetical protein
MAIGAERANAVESALHRRRYGRDRPGRRKLVQSEARNDAEQADTRGSADDRRRRSAHRTQAQRATATDLLEIS